MSKRIDLGAFALAKILMPVVGVLALAGCSGGGAEYDGIYTPTTYYNSYPIEVQKHAVKMNVKTGAGHLGPKQADTVARFAQSASGNAISTVYIRRPSGGGKSSNVAYEIAGILKKNGIASDRIVQTTYDGGASSPVLVSYVRKVAVTKECGNWSEDVATETGGNQAYPDFGCSTQQNLAAMVSDPGDFEAPRSMSPPDQARRYTVMTKYAKGEPTGATVDSQQQIAISTVANQ